MFKDLFISYGRRESLGFVARLHQKLKLAGYEVWFDKVNIPDGEDYSARIKHGIESAHNFVYVMAARALSSPYCLIEIEYARFLGKRLIPINQAVTFAVEVQTLSEADQEVLHQFYRQHHIPDPQLTTTQAVLERSLALVGCTDWLDAKENISAQNCHDLAAWAQYHENQWHKHESLTYLQSLELPQFGETIDSLDSVIERLGLVLARHQAYVSQHTALTLQALEWSRNQALNHYLLVGAERRAAEEWLAVEFKEGEQAPCQPCDLLCDFICESRKNAENRTTDCFICYDYADKALRNHILKALARHAITTWRHDHDIQRGSQAEQAILAGIAGADNVLYFISPNALNSEACQAELEHARMLNKRIIPLLIASTPNLPPTLQNLQYIKMVNQIDAGIAELLGVLQEEAHYYKQHKTLLIRALEWQAGAYKTSFLLRGYNLENAKTWLRLNRQRAEYPPTELHVEFITASEAAKDRLGTEIFLSYSRKDADFARKLNHALQYAEKTVWFDQESISSGANFEVELYKGIQNSDNFLFVISPDSASSPYCESEVNYAVQQGKRIVTILYRETEQLPEALKFINWIDFAHQDFEKQFPELIQTLELDREHAHQHTVLQQRANEWQDNESSRDFLLNISACEKAEIWLVAASTKQPRATALQKNYITHSRQAIEAAQSRERQRHRKILGSVLIGLVLALGLSAFAWNKSEQAKTNNLVNIAHNLIVNADYTRALRVAQEAYAMNIQHPTPEIKQVMSDAYNEAALSVKSTFYQEDLRHSGAVFRALYSPDDKKILTASADGYARLWEIKQSGRDKRLNMTSLYHGDSVLYTVFSLDGRYFVTLGAEGTVKIWSAEGKEILFNVNDPSAVKRHCSNTEENDERVGCSRNGYFANFSSDSQRLLTVMSDNFILLWNMNTRMSIALNTGQMVRKAVFSPDGQYIASVGEKHGQQIIELRDGKNLNLVTSLPPTPTNCPAYSKDESCGVHLRFTPKGRLVVTQGNLIRLFSMENRDKHVVLDEEEAILNPHQANFTALFVSPHQEHASFGDSQGYVYSIDFHQTPRHLRENEHEENAAITDLHYSKDGTRLLIATNKGPVSLWSLKENKLLAQYFGHKNIVNTARFSPDERFILTASSDKTVKLWVVEQGLVNPLENLKQANLVDAVFLPQKDSHILTASQSAVHLWERASKEAIDKYDNSFYKLHKISAIDVSPDGKNFVTGTVDNWIVTRQVALGSVVQQWRHHCVLPSDQCQIEKVIYSKQGQFLIIGDSQGQIEILDLSTGQIIKQLQLTAGIKKLAVAPNNHYLAAITENGKRHVWKFAGEHFEDTSPEIVSLSTVANNVTASDIWFSKDSHYLASALSDNTARIWNFEAAKAINMDDHSARVNSVHFDPSGNEQLLTSSDDNSIKLWSWSNQQGTDTEAKVIGTFKGFDNGVTDAEIGYSGDILAISGDNVYLFPNAQRIYQWLEHNHEIYQLTYEDRRKLGMID
jgi:WD40 repeat protein